MEIQVASLGLTDYQWAWHLQQAIHARCQKTGENVVLITEHYPVVTLGYRSQADQLRLSHSEFAEKGISLIESERGGGATYHGPGQLVVYPIFSTLFRAYGVRIFISLLEEVMRCICASYNVVVQRNPGLPGVWVEERKLGAVGIAVRRGTSLHGFALNINLDLAPFGYIVPCGLPSLDITSIAQEVSHNVEMRGVLQRVCAAFQTVFAVPVKEKNDEWRCVE